MLTDTSPLWHFQFWHNSPDRHFQLQRLQFSTLPYSDTSPIWPFPVLIYTSPFLHFHILTLPHSDAYIFWHFSTLTTLYKTSTLLDSDTFIPTLQSTTCLSTFIVSVPNSLWTLLLLGQWTVGNPHWLFVTWPRDTSESMILRLVRLYKFYCDKEYQFSTEYSFFLIIPAEDTYSRTESLGGHAVKVRIMDTADQV